MGNTRSMQSNASREITRVPLIKKSNRSDSMVGAEEWEPFQMRFLPQKDKPRPKSRKNPFFSRTENDGSKLESVKEEEDPLRKCHLCDFASDCEEMHTEHLMSAHVFDLAL